MATTIRALANAAAQDAFRRLVRHYVATGVWDRHLSAEWHAAEALLDVAEERIRDMADVEWDGRGLPDIALAAIPETEARALWGDR